MKNLLLIAFHFPPYGQGSGVHRAAKFFRYLPENGWSPYVLTTRALAYERVQTSKETEELDASARRRIIRAFALDSQRHLGIKGRHIGWLGIPDRWANWVLTAIPLGLVTLYRKKISVIVVTFPIATAVLIGLILHRITGKPLIVNFRDSMTEDEYPRERFMRSVHRKIEKAVMKSGTRFIFTAESARRMYLDRYPGVPPENCLVISNGYDDEDFHGISCVPTGSGPGSGTDGQGRPVRLVHAGLVYPDERDPRAFFGALSRLKAQGIIDAGNLRIELRAAGSEEYFAGLVQQLEIQDVVFLLPSLPHKRALEDMASADGLLVLQAANCNHQIPAKVYEYLRLGRPILALTSAEGDTAALLNHSGGATIIDLADENAIHEVLPKFIEAVRKGSHPLPDSTKVSNYSRRSQTTALAQCLNQALSSALMQGEGAPSPDKSVA